MRIWKFMCSVWMRVRNFVFFVWRYNPGGCVLHPRSSCPEKFLCWWKSKIDIKTAWSISKGLK